MPSASYPSAYTNVLTWTGPSSLSSLVAVLYRANRFFHSVHSVDLDHFNTLLTPCKVYIKKTKGFTTLFSPFKLRASSPASVPTTLVALASSQHRDVAHPFTTQFSFSILNMASALSLFDVNVNYNTSFSENTIHGYLNIMYSLSTGLNHYKGDIFSKVLSQTKDIDSYYFMFLQMHMLTDRHLCLHLKKTFTKPF